MRISEAERAVRGSGELDPARYPVQQLIDELHRRFRGLNDGKLADYIPELARGDPSLFAIAVVTCDGHAYETGAADARFTIQSVSKPFVYAMALDDWGHDEVLRRIGVEPSGDPFNSVSFDDRNNRPFNPMVNSGAIAAASLIRGASLPERRSRMMNFFERFIGHDLEIDERVYRSEKEIGHRNRAIAYLELNSGMIDGNVEEHLDLYFQQCSILVTARDLATMAATLANGGLNPVTGQRALRTDHVRDVLSVMNACGMYDFAGEWQFTVGLPAKSGVGGGILAVLPGQIGIGVFSPLLDPTGNSCRGVRVCREMSQRFRLHLLADRGGASTAIRRSYRGSEVRSKRARRGSEATLLDRIGSRLVIYELQGNLAFASLERITRSVVADLETASHFVLDGSRLVGIDSVGYEMIARLARSVEDAGGTLVLAALPRLPDEATEAAWLAETGAIVAPDLDAALELCEDRLLHAVGTASGSKEAEVELAAVDILRDLTPDELDHLRPHLRFSAWDEGERIVREGDPADGMFFLTRGRADIGVAVGSDGGWHRVGTIEAGQVFGELALFSGGRRTADVIATKPVESFTLSHAAMRAAGAAMPELRVRLLTLVGQSLADRLRRANAEIRALSR